MTQQFSVIDIITSEKNFFNDLNPTTLSIIAGCGKVVSFEGGQWLAKEGSSADHFYLIQNGHVAIEVHHPSQNALIIQTVHAGDVVGWSWIFPNSQWAYDVRAVTSVKAIQFDGICLRNKMDLDPVNGMQILKKFTALLSERLKSTRHQLLDLYGQKEA